MHSRFTLKAFNRPFQSGNTPIIHLIKENIKCGLVKLDNINTRGLLFSGSLIENPGKPPSQFFAAFIMIIIQRIDHSHGTWQSPFYGLLGLLTQEPGIFNKDRLLPRNSTHDRRYARIIAITNSNGFTFFKINAAEVLNKGSDKMLARLLTITDNINTCLLLFLQRHT